MKNILIIITIIILVIIVVLTVLNLMTTRSIRTEIVIDAPKEKVWNILINHKSYPDWNPFIKQISGPVEVGEHILVTLQNGKNGTANFKPEVLVNQKNKEFRWIGKLLIKGIADGEHYFILEEIDTNQTKLIHGEQFTGLLSGLFMKIVGKNTKKGFIAMNEAMAQQAEIK